MEIYIVLFTIPEEKMFVVKKNPSTVSQYSSVGYNMPMMSIMQDSVECNHPNTPPFPSMSPPHVTLCTPKYSHSCLPDVYALNNGYDPKKLQNESIFVLNTLFYDVTVAS